MTEYQFGRNFSALLAEYESDGAGRLVTRAYRDPGGRWTGPGGMTFHQDGRPVREGDTWTEAQALDLIAWGKRLFAREIVEALPAHFLAEMTQNQFDALGVFCWNNGTDVLHRGELAEALQARPARLAEAARAMTLYRRMTLWGGTTGPDGLPVRDPDGKVMPEGLSWFKAMRGILRRSCASACLFLSLDWREATALDRIRIAKRADWVEAERRWVDTVVDQTPWKDILDTARRSPLPDRPAGGGQAAPAPKASEAPAATAAVQGRVVVLPPDWDRMAPDEQTAWLNGEQREHLETVAAGRAATAPPASPPVPAPPPAPSPKPKTKTTAARAVPIEQVPYLDEAAKAAPKAKDIGDSQRGIGFARQKQAEALGAAAVGGFLLDQMNLVRPILDFTAKYTPSQIAAGALILGVPTVGLWYYGKWRRRKGEDEADTLLR